MRTIFPLFGILIILLVASACLHAMAKIPAAGEKELAKCLNLISQADLVLLDGAVTVERMKGYQCKWNSSSLTPGLKKGEYGGSTFSSERTTVGGTNNSTNSLHVITLIPLYQYRDKPTPEEEVLSVTVNDKPAECMMLLPGASVKAAIASGLARFKNDRLFTSQLSAAAPTLFIDAGMLAPGKDLKIEYTTKPRNYRIN